MESEPVMTDADQDPNTAREPRASPEVLRSYYRPQEPHLKQWPDIAAVLRRFRPARAKPVVLDLGSGSGQYSQRLHECLDGDVVALEPDPDMLVVARQERPHNGHRWVRAGAEWLPLRTGSVDLVWASSSLHHVRDLPAAVAEILRVLTPKGLFVFRGTLAGRLGEVALYREIPSARDVDERRLFTLDDLVELCGPQLGPLHVERLDQSVAASLADYHRLLSTRPFSVLHLLADEVWEREIAAMGERARRPGNAEIRERLDLVVLGPATGT
jgi:SAM-dependent methyltransferase